MWIWTTQWLCQCHCYLWLINYAEGQARKRKKRKCIPNGKGHKGHRASKKTKGLNHKKWHQYVYFVKMDVVVAKYMSSGLHTKYHVNKQGVVVDRIGQLGQCYVVRTHLSTNTIHWINKNIHEGQSVTQGMKKHKEQSFKRGDAWTWTFLWASKIFATCPITMHTKCTWSMQMMPWVWEHGWKKTNIRSSNTKMGVMLSWMSCGEETFPSPLASK